MFAKPQTNVTFFTRHPGNNFGPKRSWLLRRHVFSRSRENWMSYLVDLLENAKFYLGFSFSWGVSYRWHCCIVSSVWNLGEISTSSIPWVISKTEHSTPLAVQWCILEAKHHVWRGKGDIIRQNVLRWAVVRLGMMLLLFQKVSSGCGLKIKFLMPLSQFAC